MGCSSLKSPTESVDIRSGGTYPSIENLINSCLEERRAGYRVNLSTFGDLEFLFSIKSFCVNGDYVAIFASEYAYWDLFINSLRNKHAVPAIMCGGHSASKSTHFSQFNIKNRKKKIQFFWHFVKLNSCVIHGKHPKRFAGGGVMYILPTNSYDLIHENAKNKSNEWKERNSWGAFLEDSVFLTGHLKVSCIARKDKQYFISIGDATNNKKLSFKLD